MKEANIIVMSSSICFYSMSAQLKALIDRTYSFHQKLAGKTLYFFLFCTEKKLHQHARSLQNGENA